MKTREILTYPLSTAQFWEEFRYFVDYFDQRNFNSCGVLFGFAWGIEYYPDKDWEYEEMPIRELEERIVELEQRGFGQIGNNDVFIQIADVEFRFCNDCDVHIGFDSQVPLIEDFYQRWESLGYQPAEWLKNEENGPGERVRGGRKDA